MTVALTCTPERCSAFALDRERRSSRQAPSPPSTTCLENFSLPGLLIVTTHFDLLNSSEDNSVIIIRAGGGRDSGRGGDRLHRLPPCWCGSSAYQVGPPSTRIGSFSALLSSDALSRSRCARPVSPASSPLPMGRSSPLAFQSKSSTPSTLFR